MQQIQLNTKTTAALNSKEMGFWRCLARFSRMDKIRNTIIKQKMNATRSLLDNVKMKQLQCMDIFNRWTREDYQKNYKMAT